MRKEVIELDAQIIAAASVAGSISKFSCAEKRKARKMRSASSEKRTSGSPTARKIPFSRSSRPPNRSTSPTVSFHAMALTVKSRRDRSSAIRPVKATASGWRPSE